MNNNIDLSIIIVSDKKDLLISCLKSLTPALKNIKSEILLIDNASKDNIGDLAKRKYPEIKIIRRKDIGGYGENNNLGLKIANGKYILLLNDDTEIINKDIFEGMIKWMDKHPNVGVSGCALLNEDKITYQGSGGYYPSLLRVFMWMTFLDDIPLINKLVKPYHPLHANSPLGKGEEYYKHEHKQDWITGAFYLIRKNALDEVGLFDEDFFLYVEEVELSKRILEKGWQIWYLPEWKIIHYGQASTGNDKAVGYEMKNLILLYKKHEQKWKIPVLRAILKLGVFLRIILWSITGKTDKVKSYEKTISVI